MGTVTGFTAARTAEIEAATIIDGDVVGNNLHLKRHDGGTIDAGPVKGPPGEGAYLRHLLAPAVKIITNGPNERVTTHTVGSAVADVGFAPDSRHLAYITDSQLAVRLFDGSTLVSTTGPNHTSSPNVTYRRLAWSPRGSEIALGSVTGNKVYVVKFDGYTLSRVTQFMGPSDIVEGTVTDVAWSPDGRYILVSHTEAPYITVYAYAAETVNSYIYKVSSVDTTPTGPARSVSWSPDGTRFAVAHDNSPYLSVYNFSNGGTCVKRGNPAALPAGNGIEVNWSPDGRYLALLHSGSPFLTAYFISKESGSFGKLPDLTGSAIPTGVVRDFCWSADGRQLVVAATGSQKIRTYRFDNEALLGFTSYHIATWTDTEGRVRVDWTTDAKTIVFSMTDPPEMQIHKCNVKYFNDGQLGMGQE